ncbi:MAG TPA: response regulator [Desulfonatronum sp.]|nr:response regulator [Desulfonatronum sp.]
MSIISIFHGSFCRHKEVVRALSLKTGLPVTDDHVLLDMTAQRLGCRTSALIRTLMPMDGPRGFLALERKRNLAAVKTVLADSLREDMIFSGSFVHLIPRSISHALHVLLIAEFSFRVRNAATELNIPADTAKEQVLSEDAVATAWTEEVLQREPWDHDLYDLVIPMDRKKVEDAVKSILSQVTKDILRPTPDSRKAVEDFRLAAQVEQALAEEGHAVLVEADAGLVVLTIVRSVIMLAKMEAELRDIVAAVPGVREVHVQHGPDFYQKSMYRKHEPEASRKLLLVDDEREFVHTLSERLLMREIGSAVVYDGEQALAFVEEDEPDVMVLDLKMPGIDGLEVLRRVKARHPHVRVIILTGHGSKDDERRCLERGAFAYLQKPVDIDVLTQLLQQARKDASE